MRTKSFKSLLTACVLLMAMSAVRCGNPKPVLPGQASSPFPGTITGEKPRQLTPAEVEAAKEAAATSPLEKRILQRAYELQQKSLESVGQQALATSEGPFMRQARAEILKEDSQLAKNRAAWAKALVNAHVTGCPAGTVVVNPSAVKFDNFSAQVTMLVVNNTGSTVDIATAYHGIGNAVSNLCAGGSATLAFALGIPETYQTQNVSIVLTAIGKNADGTTFTRDTQITLYNSCSFNTLNCSLQKEDRPWKIQ